MRFPTAAVDAFNEANSGIEVYMVDYHEAIILDESILEEWRRENSQGVPDGIAAAGKDKSE